MFEIKLSQGAKSGKAGILLRANVTGEIAHIRAIAEVEESITSNRNPAVYSAGVFLEAIARVRRVTGKPVGYKAVIGVYGWLDELCLLIKQRGSEHGPNFITIDSSDGATGAAPASLIDYMGLLLKESLPLVAYRRSGRGLRKRIRIIASGKLTKPGQVAWAMCAGVDLVVSARSFMLALAASKRRTVTRTPAPPELLPTTLYCSEALLCTTRLSEFRAAPRRL